MGNVFKSIRKIRDGAAMDLRVRSGRGTEDAAAMKQAFEDNWESVQAQLDSMCKAADKDRTLVAESLVTEYGDSIEEIVNALIKEPCKDTFLMEWDLLEYEKIKDLADKLISEGSIKLSV